MLHRALLLASFLACAVGCSLLYPLDYRTAPYDATAPDAAQRTLAPGFPTNFQAQPIPSPSNQ